jgi:hypothetical protein
MDHSQESLFQRHAFVGDDIGTGEPEAVAEFHRQPVRGEGRRGQGDTDQPLLARLLQIVHHRRARDPQRRGNLLLVAAVMVIHPGHLDHRILAADLGQIAPPCRSAMPRPPDFAV